MKNFLLGLIAGAAVAGVGFSLKNHLLAPSAAPQFGSACTAEQLEHNRQLVRFFFAPERSPLDAFNMMTPDYVQHNEGVKRFGQINGLKDREAFKAIDEILTKTAQRPELLAEPGRPKNEMAFKIIATCDYVVAMHRTQRLAKPQSFVSSYESGQRRIDLLELVRIAKALNLRPLDLVAEIFASLPSSPQ